jgi:hypothetical protein
MYFGPAVSGLLALSTPAFVAHWTLHPDSMFSQIAAAAEEVDLRSTHVPYTTTLFKYKEAAGNTVNTFQNASQGNTWFPSQPGIRGYESCMEHQAKTHQEAKEHQDYFSAAARKTVQRLRTFCARHKESHVSPELAAAYFDDFKFGYDLMTHYYKAISTCTLRASVLQPQCHKCALALQDKCRYSLSNTRRPPAPRERKRDKLRRR